MGAVLPIAILAIIQGITEFLPISSSGHLVLTWHAFDYYGLDAPAREGAHRLILDVAVHVGSLGAVILYLWRDVLRILGGLGLLLIGRWSDGARLFFLLVLGTIPVVAAGYLMKITVGHWRSVEVVAWTSIVFGIALYVADNRFLQVRKLADIALPDALIVGLAQVLALIPGTSRSGITMTAARALGFERTDAARFSMLLSIPTIVGAGVLLGMDLYESGDVRLQEDAILAFLLSLISAFAAIAAMMAWLRRASFTPFVVYRILLGIGLLYLVYVVGMEWRAA